MNRIVFFVEIQRIYMSTTGKPICNKCTEKIAKLQIKEETENDG